MIREIVEKICTQCVGMVHEPQFWKTIQTDSDYKEHFITCMMFFTYVISSRYFNNLLNKTNTETLAQIIVSLLKETEDDQEKFEMNPIQYVDTYIGCFDIPNVLDKHHVFNYDLKNCALTILYYVAVKLNGFLTFITLFATDVLECTINSNSQTEVRVNTSLSLVNFPTGIEKTNLSLIIISALKKSIQLSRQDLTEQVIQKLSAHLCTLFQHNLFIRVKSYFLFMN